ncbi:hypothetical protein [Nostoc sp. PA-18-2419]|uniref:hypothetical protein n=1 Tax=Nostoc sp. PA-18-2419 TaxID=2575443 RepID=UPI001109D56E|nr:hypothetical protein [Nostoc sp. PA-18-2419]
MKLIKLLLPAIMASIIVCPAAVVQAKPVICSFDIEDPSEIKRTVALSKMGIKIEIPANYRAIAKADGSIDFTDNGTYQLFDCLSKNPGALGGRGYPGITVYKSKNNYLYSNVQDMVTGMSNFFIVWEKKQVNNTTFHNLKLRIKTKKGIIEVEQIDEEPIENEQQANELRTRLIQIASTIDIL